MTALFVRRLTETESTPASDMRCVSIADEQLAHVMPSMARLVDFPASPSACYSCS